MASRSRALLKEILIGIAFGVLGFIVNSWKLELLPGVYLIFGAVSTLLCAARYGPLSGGAAGLLAGLRTWWLWGQWFPASVLWLCGEGVFVGYARRRRLLYAVLSYWLLLGSWAVLLVQRYLFGLTWQTSLALGLRSLVNGFFCALIAEGILLLYSLLHRRRTQGEPQMGHASVISFALMLGIFIPVSLSIIGITRYILNETVESVRADALARATSTRRDISRRIETYRRTVEMTANLVRDEGIGLDDATRLNVLLDAARWQNPELAGMYVADEKGRAVAHSPQKGEKGESLIGTNYSDRQYYRDLMRTRRTVLSGVYQERKGKNAPTAAIAAPIFDKDSGRVIGFVAAWYDLKPFHDVAFVAISRNLRDQALITDADGYLIADSDRPAEDYKEPISIANTPLYRETSSSDMGVRMLNDSTGGARGLGSSSWVAWDTIPEANWKVIVKASLWSVEEFVIALYLKALAILSCLTLIAVLISHLIGRFLSRPFELLERGALRLASGDLSSRPSLSRMRTREAYRLAQAFSQMADSIEQALDEQHALTLRAKEAAREARAHAAWIAALDKIGQELSSTFDLLSICRAARRYASSQTRADNLIISDYDEATGKIACVYAWVGGEERDPHLFPPLFLSESVHSRCIRLRQPIIINDLSADDDESLAYSIGESASSVRSVFYLPLIACDRVVGTLQVQSHEPNSYSQADVERMMLLANHIAIAISNARLFEQVQQGKVDWETTFDSMSDGVFIFGEDGRLRRANRVAAEMENSSVEQLIGRRCCEVMTEDGGGTCLVAEAIGTGQRVARELRLSRFEHPLLITVEPLRAEGRICGAIAIARDLSDLRRAEEEAHTQRELVSQLIEFAQEAICAIDTRGRTRWFNRRLCEATGFSAEELQDGTLSEIVHSEDLERTRQALARALSGERNICEARFVRRDGEIRWFTASFSPVRTGDAISFVLVVARDVTDERRAAEQMELTNKLAAVGQLAAGVAHDFNNLLAVILGRAQLLKKHAIDERMKKSLEVIERAALDGAATVNRLQNFARRRTDEASEPVAIKQLLQDVLELTRTRWRDDALAKGIRYEVELAADEDAIVMGIASELREVFTNLIINALDAMPKGGRLLIEARRHEGKVILRFADTGVGMTEEVKRRIFEPFFTTKGHAGTGLGLAVSYGIIERHGGQIEVESELGRGTVFTITLPARDKASSSAPQESSGMSQTVCALIIDDEEIVRETLADILIEMGHTVVKASSGEEGLRWLEKSSFDVVFTDLSMPEMDGWTVARHVRARWPNVKLLLVTGYGATIELNGETADLVDAVISKPFVFDKISAALERVMAPQPLAS
ncbi:PAS domain S-box protein [Pyrinomonas methylaliphatogenes]|uniref:histidine kinase n=1 Tax=Pyrinomonas methylaliphatogenes TaxID=454194 RepID=A0A0B6X123_9BACT|nr:PAS domain S-box protein [Pyrinomonas methylaliphatogenes]CDM66677.1 PAS domain S-box [Pyrinomonas methylaliphatogenes]